MTITRSRTNLMERAVSALNGSQHDVAYNRSILPLKRVIRGIVQTEQPKLKPTTVRPARVKISIATGLLR
ncbi:MAG: hypothetical protein WCA35_10520 [Kovacikia sp.]